MADTLVDDFDVVDLLTLVADRCVEVLDVAAAGLMVAEADGELRVAASSSEAMRVLELFELRAEEGPCPECYRTGLPVVDVPLSVPDVRWPNFAPQAHRSWIPVRVRVPDAPAQQGHRHRQPVLCRSSRLVDR